MLHHLTSILCGAIRFWDAKEAQAISFQIGHILEPFLGAVLHLARTPSN